MATMRFNLTAVASKAFETETWVNFMTECANIFMPVKVKRSDIEGEMRWEATLKKEQNEARNLCHFAVRELIPLAGKFQMNLLDSVLQAATVYAPEIAESIYNEGNKLFEEISAHISAIHYNARKMREASSRTNKESDAHLKVVLYHNSVMPYVDTLRFHVDRLNEIMRVA